MTWLHQDRIWITPLKTDLSQRMGEALDCNVSTLTFRLILSDVKAYLTLFCPQKANN